MMSEEKRPLGASEGGRRDLPTGRSKIVFNELIN